MALSAFFGSLTKNFYFVTPERLIEWGPQPVKT